MRLTPSQIESIYCAGQAVLGPQVSIKLFGSRTRNDLKGGDIDLLFEPEHPVPNRAQAICSIQGAPMLTLGNRKIDILLKDPRTFKAAIFQIAKRTGVTL